MKQKFNVTGMTCSACSAHVDKAVRRLDGGGVLFKSDFGKSVSIGEEVADCFLVGYRFGRTAFHYFDGTLKGDRQLGLISCAGFL